MEWSDEGIVLGVKPHGERSVVLELMTREHGRHLGLVRGGRDKRFRPVLQSGNLLSATWRARLDQHLGYYAVEALVMRVGSLLQQSHALYGLMHLASLCRLLPERDPHPLVVPTLEAILDCMHDTHGAAGMMVQFELQLLADLGFGLDLDRCALTGSTADLVYVSPRTGRAVSREAGAPWKHKLLALPAFLISEQGVPSPKDIADGFRLTGHFLSRRVFEPRGIVLPQARGDFIGAVLNPRSDGAGANDVAPRTPTEL